MDSKALEQEYKKLIETAIAEDIRSGDISSEACIQESDMLSAKLICKEWGCIAGFPLLQTVFQMINPTVKIKLFVKEGEVCNAGTLLASITGSARSIISGERIALSIMQHASGIATTTTLYKEELADYKCDLLDTRATLPGLRALEKYAVRVGGGKNHRQGLDDCFIIKSNHVRFIRKDCKTPFKEAVEKARAYRPEIPVEVQIDNLQSLEEVLSCQPDRILLDRMNIFTVQKAVRMIRKKNKKIYIEVHGHILLDNVSAYAETGVNGISVPALTHSVQDLDICLRF